MHGYGYASGSASKAAGNLVGAAALIEQVPRCEFRKGFNRRARSGESMAAWETGWVGDDKAKRTDGGCGWGIWDEHSSRSARVALSVVCRHSFRRITNTRTTSMCVGLRDVRPPGNIWKWTHSLSPCHVVRLSSHCHTIICDVWMDEYFL